MLYTINLMLALILGITAMGGNVTRAQDLSVSEVSGVNGEIVEAKLILTNNMNVASVGAFIRIADSNVAEFIITDPETGKAMVQAGPALTPNQSAFGNVQPDGRLRVIVINSNPIVDPVPFNNGVLAIISLKITGQGGSTDLRLEGVECADDLAVTVPCNLK